MTVEQYQQAMAATGINRGKLEADSIDAFNGDSQGAKRDLSTDLSPEEKEENRRRNWVYKTRHKELIAKRRKQWESENCGKPSTTNTKTRKSIVYGKQSSNRSN